MTHRNAFRILFNPPVNRFRLIWGGIFGLSLLIILAFPSVRRVAGENGSEGPVTAVSSPETTLGALVISEFRLRGINGVNDEFIEIYNNFGGSHTVASISGTGYGVAASDGVLRCTIPNGTIIPANGHFLCANSVGYSLATYPAGNGTTATANATYTTDIPDNAGIALFNNNSGGGSFSLANRFDAVGSTSEANTLYKEGTGYTALNPLSTNYTLYRKFNLVNGLPTDTNNNATDLDYADTNGTFANFGQDLGAPGPQSLSSAISGINTFAALPLDATKAVSVPSNVVRDFTMDAPNNSTFGTVSVRRRFVNQTGANITRLRFRIMDISTFPSPSLTADLRPRNSGAVVVAGINDAVTCAATGAPATPPCTVTVQGTTLETPPAQPNGGGFNSSLSAGTVTLGTPLANGASIDLQFLFGIQQNGNYRLALALETLPGGGTIFLVNGNTQIGTNSDARNSVADFDGDFKSDLSVFRPSNASWFLLRSSAGFTGSQFGISTDRIVPADYDGDGKTDIAVYRPSIGTWFIINSLTNTLTTTNFGIAEDLPTPADYDGDGKADLSVFRPSNGTWFRLNSRDGTFFPFQFGQNGDKPVIGDYDGDGKYDVAVYRPSAGSWYRINSGNGTFTGVQFGISTDLTTPGDFDGDGKTDIAVFRPSVGTWFRLNSGNGAFFAQQFGTNGDIPAPGDFDGDGKEDISVFRPADGGWYRLNSSNGAFFAQAFGTNGD
ncbi:MAG: FG-GAP-like repeat-containing protein, partial [Pyrinomonadaceae bacterium]